MKFFRTFIALLAAVLFAAGASAQSKGNLKITGKVLNQAGQPVDGADVRAAKKGESKPQMFETKTNKDGEFTIKDIAAGDWVIEVAKDGVGVTEVNETVSANKTISITIAPKVDPNAEIQSEHKRAIELAQASKFAEARAVYQALLAKYPTVHQLHGMLGTMYAAENNAAKALEHLKIALEKDASNVEWQALSAELMMELGDKEGAQKVLDSIDITKVREPRAFVNSAINKINSGDKVQAEQAVDLLSKLMAQFPNDHMLLYLRARAYIVGTKMAEAKADLEKYVAAAPATAPQMADAKKLLEQLSKK